jgi:hypothetical protein
MTTPLKTAEDKLHDAEKIIRQKNAEINSLRASARKRTELEDTAESIRETIWGLSAHTPDAPEWLSGRSAKPGTRGGPTILISDMHYGEVVNKDEVAGVNEYNKTIAAKRFKKLIDVTIDLSYNHMGRAKVEYPGIVAAFAGDNIGGDIHEELARTNDRTNQQAIEDLTDLFAGGIEQLASAFGRVFVPWVIGNHPRSTKKSPYKQRVFTNYEWNLGCNLERYFRKEKHIQIAVPNETDYFYKLYGHRYLLTHGDTLGVKGGDGIIGALGPIMRGRLKVGQSEAQIGRDFDTLIMGHWHQYIHLQGLIVNGTIKGYDEFARLAGRFKYQRPTQALWFTHPEKGITAAWPVYLEELRRYDQDKTWLSWQT